MVLAELHHNSSRSLYVQLYEHLRQQISDGSIREGEKLPSLRQMAEMLGISVTTVKVAYDQLIVEGYLESKPSSGFYAAGGAGNNNRQTQAQAEVTSKADTGAGQARQYSAASCDPASFDFVKWKKCMASVLNETPELLLTAGDRQGEASLRREIAEHLYKSRGVVCTEDQVVISAGTQQLVGHIARLLKMMDIAHVCTEEPGYTPVRNIFRDWGFAISNIPVRQDGIEIEKLPANIRTAVYVCPQNQFPTGAVMPIGRRHQLLEWARDNDSIIIEDDYNSELRYFGMPVPALQGLDRGNRVVYLGSFSSTLFPAVRISYMVLPRRMQEMYRATMMNYDQTCSKTEQLTLALFMQRGYYQTNLRKIRKLYSRKLQEVLSAIAGADPEGGFITAENSRSGINLILRIKTCAKTITEGMTGAARSETIHRELVSRMTHAAADLGLRIKDIEQLDRDGQLYFIFYYNQIPAGSIRRAVADLTDAFKSAVMKGSLSMPAVYEVLRVKNGRALFVHEHYERLSRSLGSLGLAVPFTESELENCINEMIRSNNIQNHNLKIEADVSGHSYIFMSPTHYPAAELYEKGVAARLFRGERKNPNVKMMDQALRDATDKAIRASGCYEVLLVDRNGNITEGSRSNVFFIKGDKVFTSPAEQVLLGVTRLKVIEIIGDLGLTLEEQNVKAADIADFDAAFISGTSPEVLPIATIDETAYDVNNKVLRAIMEGYSKLS